MWMYSTTAARQSHQNVVSCQRTTAVIYGGWRRHSPSLQSFLKGETKKEKFKQTKIFIKRINRNNVGVEWIPIEPFKERPPSTPPYMRTGTANICSLTPCDFLSHWSIFQLTRHHKGWFQRKRREKRGEKKSHKNAADVKLVMRLFTSLFDWNHDAIYTGIQYQMGFECWYSFPGCHSSRAIPLGQRKLWLCICFVPIKWNIKSWHSHRHLNIFKSVESIAGSGCCALFAC